MHDRTLPPPRPGRAQPDGRPAEPHGHGHAGHSHHAHDAHDAHDTHDGGHAHGAAPAFVPPASPAASVLLMSAPARLGVAAALAAVLWALVAWALA